MTQHSSILVLASLFNLAVGVASLLAGPNKNGADSKRVVAELIEAIESGHDNAFIDAIDAVKKTGATEIALARLMDVLNNPDFEQRIWQPIGRPIPKERRRASARARAIFALEQVSRETDAELIVPVIIEAFEERIVLYTAAECLSRLTSRSKLALPALINGLRSRNKDLRDAAVYGLASLASRPTVAKEAIASLVNALDDQDDSIRIVAATALAQIPQLESKAVPILVGMLNSSTHREAAAKALGSVGPRSTMLAVPALHKALKERGHRDLRVSAAESLWKLEGNGGELAPVLVEVLENADQYGRFGSIRQRAAVLLGEIRVSDERVLTALSKGLQDWRNGIRLECAESLRKLRGEAVAKLSHPWRARTVLKGHESSIHSIAYSRDSRFLATVGGVGKVRLWNLDTGKHLRLFNEGNTGHALAFSADETQLVFAGLKRSGRRHPIAVALWWNVADGHLEKSITGPEQIDFPVAIAPRGNMVAAAKLPRFSGQIIVWSANIGRPLADLEVPEGSVMQMAFSPDENLLALGYDADGRVVICDLNTRKLQASFKAFDCGIHTLEFSPDSKTLVTGSTNHRHTKLWDVATGKHLATLPTSSGCGAAFSPDGNTLLTVDYTIRPVGPARPRLSIMSLWHVASKNDRLAVIEHWGGIGSMTFSPDGRTLATGNWDDGSVTLWEVPTLK